MRVAGKVAVEDPSVEHEDYDGDYQRPEIAVEDTEKNQEEREGVDNAAGADVYAIGPREEPYQQVGPEIGAEEHRWGEAGIEKVEHGPQKQHRHRVGEEVKDRSEERRVGKEWRSWRSPWTKRKGKAEFHVRN